MGMKMDKVWEMEKQEFREETKGPLALEMDITTSKILKMEND